MNVGNSISRLICPRFHYILLIICMLVACLFDFRLFVQRSEMTISRQFTHDPRLYLLLSRGKSICCGTCLTYKNHPLVRFICQSLLSWYRPGIISAQKSRENSANAKPRNNQGKSLASICHSSDQMNAAFSFSILGVLSLF